MARVRFRPPPVEPTPELLWLLRAAFSDSFPDPLEPDRQGAARALAERLGLDAAIGARLRSLGGTLGAPPALANDFRKAHSRSAIRAALLERVARGIAQVAAQRSTPLVFLKGFALFVSGRDRSGGRAIGDLDLLVPEEEAEPLHAELRSLGYRAEGELGNEHHLATLESPEGGKVDLHFCLRGLSFAGPAWARWADLDRHGALTPAASFPANCSIPRPDVLTAHLLAHGLAHHVWTPHAYPLLLLVGDLRELLADEASWSDFLASSERALVRSVPESEVEAMRRLVLDLGAGRVPSLSASPASDAALLLRHILGGYIDAEYAERLRARHVIGRLGDAARQGRLGHYLARRIGRKR